MKIYLARDNVQAGPYTLDELNRMLGSGEVLPTDLMWHSGMSAWQSVGQMTGGANYYQPQIISPAPKPEPSPQPRSFGDNVDFNPPNNSTDGDKRVSVAELYGRKPTDSPQTDGKSVKVVLVKRSQPQDDTSIEYASIGARFGAFAINLGLYLLALLPLVMAFMQVIDMNEVAKMTDYASMQAYSQTLASKVSKTTIAISNVMTLALLGIQLLLIIMRGQSFGKMAMGIRVVDEKTGKLPSFGTLVFMRTLFLVFAYAIGATLMSGIPAIVMLTVHYMMAKGNDKKQGWHDKMTKTLVVKAKASQLDKTKK